MRPFLTIRDLIDADRRYLDEGKLGAQTDTFGIRKCFYDYRDGRRCAVGAVLPERTLTRIHRDGLNNQPVKLLKRRVKMENFNVFAITQYIHDSWAQRGEFYGYDIEKRSDPVPSVVVAFIAERKGKIADESMFRDWLDLLDTLYPAEGAAS